MKPDDVYYLPYPDAVERVTVVVLGDSGRRFKAPILNPVTVRHASDDDVVVVGAALLYSDPLAAAIRSEEMGRAVDEQ